MNRQIDRLFHQQDIFILIEDFGLRQTQLRSCFLRRYEEFIRQIDLNGIALRKKCLRGDALAVAAPLVMNFAYFR